IGLALGNIWKARQRCLTESTRTRMTYLLLGFVAPGIAVFPYLVAITRLLGPNEPSALVLLISILGNVA
ncbi:MAG: hypothetical protein KDE01_34005, partial [Caldilineaceae bacterium]|nr:hypothetical protein [Caldilineaceae bacterium]